MGERSLTTVMRSEAESVLKAANVKASLERVTDILCPGTVLAGWLFPILSQALIEQGRFGS